MNVTLVLDERAILVIRNALWLTQQSAAAADALVSSQVDAALKATESAVAADPSPSEPT